MTDHEWIQKHALAGVTEAYYRLEVILNEGSDLTYDEVNDVAQILNVAASRLKP